ncbi:hypothetical protein [Nocardia sp. NPDC059228]|uniref:hypothetical protein n=1 Tax=Nocardia sp. NPDC059228 TaxID=3346777 RepID=UPI00368A756F
MSVRLLRFVVRLRPDVQGSATVGQFKYLLFWRRAFGEGYGVDEQGWVSASEQYDDDGAIESVREDMPSAARSCSAENQLRLPADYDGAVRIATLAAGFDWTWYIENDLQRFCDAAGWSITGSTEYGDDLRTDLRIQSRSAKVGFVKRMFDDIWIPSPTGSISRCRGSRCGQLLPTRSQRSLIV